MNTLRLRQLHLAIAALISASTHSIAMGAQPDQVVVTASRLHEPIDDVIGSVSVITREDIERRQVQSVQDLLRGETGISVANNGGFGKISSMFVRGAEADQVLVLVNGIRVGSATAGTTRIEYLPVDQIERIEIVRGPRSSLYGADAIGGVIQIFTRETQGPTVSVGAGSHDTQTASGSFGLKGESTWLSVSGNYLESEGFNSCRPSPRLGGFYTGGCFTDEPDKDGFRNASGSLRAGVRWGEKADIEASALYASGTTEYDGSFGNETDFVEAVYALKGHVAAAENWDLTLLVGNSRDEADDFSDGVYVSTFDTQRRNASLQSDWSLSDSHTVSVGVDYIDDRVDSTTDYERVTRDNTGIFGQYIGRFGAHEVLASARTDDNEQFGSHATGSLGWKWFIADAFAVHAGWGSAFLAPSFNDLYYPFDSGNPDLLPEESDSVEIGASGTLAKVRWTAAAFQTQIDDMIVYTYNPVLQSGRPENINEAKIRGLELEAQTQFKSWSFGVGYTALDPRNRGAGANYDNILPRRARQSGRIDVGYAIGDFNFGTRVNLVGSRYDDIANSRKLDRYSLIDLTGEWQFGSDWSLQAKVANALDEEYETASYYYQDGRAYFMTLQFRPAAR